MRTDLSHLPLPKQIELDHVVKRLFDGFFAALQRQPNGPMGQILKVILFGSYARGDYVEDRETLYFSDYDLLVVVNDERFTDIVSYWLDTKRALVELYLAHALS